MYTNLRLRTITNVSTVRNNTMNTQVLATIQVKRTLYFFCKIQTPTLRHTLNLDGLLIKHYKRTTCLQQYM